MHYDYSLESFSQSDNDTFLQKSTTDEIVSFNTYKLNKVTPTVHGMFFVLGATFNIVTILVIVKGQRFGKKIQIQLINLAIADLLSSLLTPFGNGNIEYVTMPFPDNAALCKAAKYIMSIAFYSSLLCHMSISLERFVAVYFPFRMVNYTKEKVVVVNVLVWIAASVSQIVFIFLSDVVPNPLKPNSFLCYTEFYSLLANQLVPYFGFIVFFPTITIFISYTSIVVKLQRKKRLKISTHNRSTSGNNKVIAMLATSGVIAVGIWQPFFIFSAINTFSEAAIPNAHLLSEIFYQTILVNIFVTPMIYFIFSKNYRKDMAEILGISYCKTHCLQETDRPVSPSSYNIASHSNSDCTAVGMQRISHYNVQDFVAMETSVNIATISITNISSTVL